jgi:hypothetical protein
MQTPSNRILAAISAVVRRFDALLNRNEAPNRILAAILAAAVVVLVLTFLAGRGCAPQRSSAGADMGSKYELVDENDGRSPINSLAYFLAYQCQFLYWGAAWQLSRRRLAPPAGNHISRGFLLMCIASILVGFLPWQIYHYLSWMTPWLYLAAVASLVVGTAGLAGSGTALPFGARTMGRYYSTDELISRSATHPTANEDLDRIRAIWHEALQAVAALDPDRSGLWGNERFSRLLVLERYVDMETYEGSPCGQIRSVHVSFSGPGDQTPWMSITVNYAIDQIVVGRYHVENTEVLRAGNDASRMFELERIRIFLRSGKAPKRLYDWLSSRLLQTAKSLALAPIAFPVLMAGLAFSPVKWFLEQGHRRSRFVLTRRPDMLPSEQGGLPVGYWNALLPELAGERQAVLDKVQQELAARAQFGIKSYQKDVVQWGGFAIKEVRQQTVLELRRAKVYVGVYSYGKDLYVRWDSHINRQTWMLLKFPYTATLGYRFQQHLLAWAMPFFVRVPDVFEYAPRNTDITDYDWADVDALQDLAHEFLTDQVRELKQRHQLRKEIDFEMKQGSRTDSGSRPADGEQGEKRKSLFRRAFSRQQ